MLRRMLTVVLFSLVIGCVDTSGVENSIDKNADRIERIARGRLTKAELRQLCRICTDASGEIDSSRDEDGCDYPQLEKRCHEIEQPARVSF